MNIVCASLVDHASRILLSLSRGRVGQQRGRSLVQQRACSCALMLVRGDVRHRPAVPAVLGSR